MDSSDGGHVLIDTPENLTLDAEVAGIGSRFMAALVDYLIMLAMMFLLAILVRGAIRDINNPELTLALLVIAQFVIFVFYHLLFEFVWNGQTPGKRYLGLRVTQVNGMPLTVSGLLIRNFVRLFDFLPFFYGVGLLALFATKHTQRLGDLAARTIVIRERAQISLQTIKEDYTVAYYYISWNQRPPDYIDIRSLTEQDRRKIVSYLRRRNELTNRGQIVVPLAQQIAHAMGVDHVVSLRAQSASEEFLEQVARAFELAEQEARRA